MTKMMHLSRTEAERIARQINERGIYKATVEDRNLVLVVSRDDLESYVTDIEGPGEYERMFDPDTGMLIPVADMVDW